MGDAGMDGLDAMMAELSAAPKPSVKPVAKAALAPKPAVKAAPKVIDGFDASGQLVFDAGTKISPRTEQFLNRLKAFQMRVADPCTRERLNQRLSDSSADYRATTSYYEERPQLAAYTVNTEITRMKYSVTDLETVRRIFGECCPKVTAKEEAGGGGGHALRGGAESTPEGGGGSRAEGEEVPKIELVWRMANQSLLAGLMQQLQEMFGQAEDVELCISIHNTSSSFHLDLQKCTVRATTEFKVATVGGGNEAMQPLANLTGEIFVDTLNCCINQRVRDIKLLMVFDDDLEEAARSLAQGEARGGLHEAKDTGVSLSALRDGMMTYTSSAASTAAVVGGGIAAAGRSMVGLHLKWAATILIASSVLVAEPAYAFSISTPLRSRAVVPHKSATNRPRFQAVSLRCSLRDPVEGGADGSMERLMGRLGLGNVGKSIDWFFDTSTISGAKAWRLQEIAGEADSKRFRKGDELEEMLMDQIASRTLSRKGLSAMGEVEVDESESDDLFSDGFGAGYSLEDGDLAGALTARLEQLKMTASGMNEPITGAELALLCYNKYGLYHDMALKCDMLQLVSDKKLVSVNIYYAYYGQLNPKFPYSEADYLSKCDLIATAINQWNQAPYVREFFAEPPRAYRGLPSRPRWDTAVSIRLYKSPTWSGANVDEWFLT